MKKQITLRLTIYAISVVLLIAFLIVGSQTFLRKKADSVGTAPTNITATSTVTYTDTDNNTVSEQTRATISKVTPLKISAPLRGRDTATPTQPLTVSLINAPTNTTVDTLSATSVATSQYQADWTNSTKIDPTKTFDLRISTPGYLSRKLTGISLLNIPTILTSATLVAGDVNQDHKINYLDYFAWKEVYGQTVAANPSDFNGDGVVNYKDYAVSFGTHCWNANEIDQDTQCQ
ncbi:MAG: dockerin type I domain-containing protein [Candidatus Berkelbacteria bacterium]